MKRKIVKIDLRNINPNNEELTVQKLRELTGKPDMPEEEATETLLVIKIFVNIVLQYQELSHLQQSDKKSNNDHLKTAA